MDKNMIAKIYSYWNKTELGREMIKSDYISDSDLLFLIPNNRKKIIGLPITRLGNKNNKRIYKNNKYRKIVEFKIFNLLGVLIEEKLSKFNFDNFIGYKNLQLGDNIFESYLE